MATILLERPRLLSKSHSRHNVSQVTVDALHDPFNRTTCRFMATAAVLTTAVFCLPVYENPDDYLVSANLWISLAENFTIGLLITIGAAVVLSWMWRYVMAAVPPNMSWAMVRNWFVRKISA